MAIKVKLKQLSGRYAVSRLGAGDAIPAWADGQGFVSISRTDDELSVVCLQDRVPDAASRIAIGSRSNCMDPLPLTKPVLSFR